VRQVLFVSTLASLYIFSLPAIASIELPERCHHGVCSTETLESKELLRSNNLGDLYLATFSSVSYPVESFRQTFVNHHGSERVEESFQSYIFCSSSMTSTLFVTDDKEYRLNRLVLTGNSPSTAVWHSHVHYLATCHNIAGPDYFSTNVANMLIREGYNFGDGFSGNDQQMRVGNILEIMNPNAIGY